MTDAKRYGWLVSAADERKEDEDTLTSLRADVRVAKLLWINASKDERTDARELVIDANDALRNFVPKRPVRV